MHGPEIIVRSMSTQRISDRFGNQWQYHPQSDRHSKIACWAILFDLMTRCALLRRHVEDGKVGFGINHTMTDFASGRDKDLDLVISEPRSEASSSVEPITFLSLADVYEAVLTPDEEALLRDLPPLFRRPVGDVLVALEAKAAMTAHVRAGPRLFDELTSAWQCINGGAPQAIAVGFGMVNASSQFLSPKNNKFNVSEQEAVVNQERQPTAAEHAQNRVRAVSVRKHISEGGYDAKGIVTIVARNDGSPITVAPTPPSLPPSDGLHYERMILRIAGLYDGRFAAR